MARYRVTVDTGGTFSDFVYLNEATGIVTISKVPSTPDDPSRAILTGVESLAADLLLSCLHPQHETRVREIVLEEMPDLSVSLSSDIVPQIREYYRLSTTVINAYLQPILARYIAQLDRRLNAAGLATKQ